MGLPEYSRSAQEHFDKHAEYYQPRQPPTQYAQWLAQDRAFFAKGLGGKRVIDVGAGTGVDAKSFKEHGLRPVCVDLAQTMAALCKKESLDTVLMDLEHLGFGDEVADGIWAHASLHFMPKRNFVWLMPDLHRILKPDGLLYIAVPEGMHDGWTDNGTRMPGARRWCARYQQSEAERILRTYFDILHASRVSKKITQNEPFLNFLCKKE